MMVIKYCLRFHEDYHGVDEMEYAIIFENEKELREKLEKEDIQEYGFDYEFVNNEFEYVTHRIEEGLTKESIIDIIINQFKKIK